MSSSSRGRPQREVAARAQNTTEEKVTVTETSGGSAVSEMPAQDDSIKVRVDTRTERPSEQWTCHFANI